MSRHKIKLMPLTSIHIGSGEKLSNGCDFLIDDKYVYILDDKKIAAELNALNNPNILKHWADAAYRLELKQFLTSKHVDLANVSRRLRNCTSGFTFISQLSPFIMDGSGRHYVPGSSIKGAIRTAIVTTLVEQKRRMLLSSTSMDNAKFWEDELLGKIQQSFMRFIRVGDASFINGNGVTEVINTVQLKIDKKTGRPTVDTIKQYCEVITAEERNDLEFILIIDTDHYELAANSNIRDFRVKQMPNELLSIRGLFSLINNHTLALITMELQKWQGVGASDESDKMVSCLRDIKSNIEDCIEDGNYCCVMRMGNASGWRFMTGAWAEGLKDIKIGPHKSKSPKTCRIEDKTSDLLGFVMLEIEED